MSLNAVVLIVGVLFCVGCAAHAAEPNPVQVSARSEGELKTYERREWTVTLPDKYENPYNTTEIAIDATFTGPEGQKLVLPAFWLEPADPEADETPGTFVIRFAAPTAGQWQMSVAAVDKNGTRTSDPISFEVKPGASKGFVRRVPDNPLYLQFDNGAPYFIIGINLGWPEDGMGKEKAYDRWFSKFSEGGGNFARVWMCHPKFMIETRKGGLNRYGQKNSAYFDYILESAEKNNIGLMLTFNNYRDLIDKDMWGDAVWPISPYNAKNGGPAAEPKDFFLNATAREMFKRRLRYIIGRYSAFTSMVSWEYFNELENSGVLEGSNEWTVEMSTYLRTTDPYKHLISNSGDLPTAQLKVSEMDITQRHLYGDDGTIVDFIPAIMQMALANERYQKPRLVAEFGISFKGDSKFDEKGTGVAMHDSLWAVAFSGAAGTACHWWWDSYIEKRRLWNVYTGISKFAQVVDWPRRKFKPIFLNAPLKTDETGAEKFSDLTVKSSGAWCRSTERPTQILPNGHAVPALPKHIYGPDKADWKVPTYISVDMPKDGKMTIHVDEVSDCALLRVFIDKDPVMDIPLSAIPNSPGVKETKEGSRGYFKAKFDKDYFVPIKAGKHEIEFRNLAGDWMSIESVSLTGARSSKYSDVQTVSMQDPEGGETLVWLHDPQSNWKNDRDGIEPKSVDKISIEVPTPKPGKYRLDWWDTRKGEIISSQDLESDGKLKIDVPAFTRDVALRITALN